MIRYGCIMGLFLVGLLAAGCSKLNDSTKAEDFPGKERYLLADEPAGAKGVKELRQHAKDGEEVVVVGRVGGSKTPFTGRASFTIVDPSIKACRENGCECDTPWDFCCEPPDKLKPATLLIKVVDEQNRTLSHDARQLGLKELQTVVVKGQAHCDEKGNLIAVAATGLYVKP